MQEMILIEKGDYQCPRCRRVTVISKDKKSPEPLICSRCQVPMEKEERPPELIPPSKSTRPPATGARASKAKPRARTKTTRVQATTTPETVVPIAGMYRCPCCGVTRRLELGSKLEQAPRCDTCYVRMERVSS
ncbi:MAG: hypothetical protein HY319_00935 [Armatimonadetes bacterium]|nr:hypothetical protein [Armatimonadota bacterium]